MTKKRPRKTKAVENPIPAWVPWVFGASALGAVTLVYVALRNGGKFNNDQGSLVDGLTHYIEEVPTMTTGAAPAGTQERGRVYVENGTLYGPVGDPTPLTDDDMLWLGRAIVGETGGRNEEWGAAVAWTLAQNMKLIQRSSPFTTFTGVTRAYCQPISPRWATADASGCQRAPHMCTERHLERRQRYLRMTWDEFPSATQNVVTAFRAGTLPNPVPGAVDWHADPFEGATVDVGGNWFGVAQGRRLA